MSLLARKIRYNVAMATLVDSSKSRWIKDLVATKQALYKEETELGSELPV